MENELLIFFSEFISGGETRSLCKEIERGIKNADSATCEKIVQYLKKGLRDPRIPFMQKTNILQILTIGMKSLNIEFLENTENRIINKLCRLAEKENPSAEGKVFKKELLKVIQDWGMNFGILNGTETGFLQLYTYLDDNGTAFPDFHPKDLLVPEITNLIAAIHKKDRKAAKRYKRSIKDRNAELQAEIDSPTGQDRDIGSLPGQIEKNNEALVIYKKFKGTLWEPQPKTRIKYTRENSMNEEGESQELDPLSDISFDSSPVSTNRVDLLNEKIDKYKKNTKELRTNLKEHLKEKTKTKQKLRLCQSDLDKLENKSRNYNDRLRLLETELVHSKQLNTELNIKLKGQTNEGVSRGGALGHQNIRRENPLPIASSSPGLHQTIKVSNHAFWLTGLTRLEGIIYKNDDIQVGLRITPKIEFCLIEIYIANISHITIHDLATYLVPTTSLNIKINKQEELATLLPRAKTDRAIAVKYSSSFEHYPILKLTYSGREYMLLLPIVLPLLNSISVDQRNFTMPSSKMMVINIRKDIASIGDLTRSLNFYAFFSTNIENESVAAMKCSFAAFYIKWAKDKVEIELHCDSSNIQQVFYKLICTVLSADVIQN